MKEIFGFDLDGVLYPWHKPAYDYIKHTCNEKRSFENFWQDAIDGTDGYSDLFWKNLVAIPTLYEKIPARSKDVEALRQLSQEFYVLYISHRPAEVYLTTKLWLKRYGFPNYSELHLIETTKDVAIRTLGVDFYIEDKPDILNSNLRDVTNLIAFRTLWNWDECEQLPYVDYLEELPEVIQEIR